MSDNTLNMLSLEKELTSIEEDALADERESVERNYALLEQERKEISIPFPEVHPYDTGIDYEDISDIQYKKGQNQPAWDRIAVVDRYLTASKLFVGHCLMQGGANYYIIDHPSLASKNQIHNQPIHMINADDKDYASIIRMWRYPSEDKRVSYSRNIHMRNRQVDAVDVVLDRSNQIASDITDFFLRKALLRNKNKSGIESIIQTIQEKQDKIRLLPQNQSFVVQGCAGSGKTMVLLHRLRYLLFNNDIDSEEYLVLVPTTNFGTFIKDACAEFRIQANNVIPVQSYYKRLSGEKQIDAAADASELVFSPEYLKRVYSREFVQDACRDLLSMFETQMDTLTACCDAALSALIDQTTTELNEKISQSKQVALARAVSIAELLIPYVQTRLNAYEDIPSLIAEIGEDRDMADREYQRILNENPLLFLSAEEIIAADATLQQMQSEIKSTEEKVARASIFTVNAQKRKLEKLKQNYEERCREITQRAEAAEKKRIEEQAKKAQYVYDGISIEDAGNILSKLSRIYDETEQTITDAQNAVENIQDTLEKRYSKEISLLVKVIESPVSIAEACADSINALDSIIGVLSQYMQVGSELYDLFLPLCPTRERKQMENQCKLYKSRMERDRANYLNLLLFNACKRRIRNEFDVKISSAYKHYWYLQTYCAYLTKGIRETPRRYLYIDEAQDLSMSEIELMRKVNIAHNDDQFSMMPVLNLFGDVHQTITQHGVHDWSEVAFIPNVYTLNENFRNTNQIVAFCNSRFKFKMQQIGVDMEPVRQYETVEDALPVMREHESDLVFIVKDDYAKKDLHDLLYQYGISSYETYTVKEAKGLEFKWVCVFDDDMNIPESYIAYTRALVGLIVVKKLPRIESNHVSLIIAGAETDDEESTE